MNLVIKLIMLSGTIAFHTMIARTSDSADGHNMIRARYEVI